MFIILNQIRLKIIAPITQYTIFREAINLSYIQIVANPANFRDFAGNNSGNENLIFFNYGRTFQMGKYKTPESPTG